MEALRIRGGATVGELTAELDVRLTDVFYDNGQFQTIVRMDDRRSFIVGRTGSGKSASLAHLEAQRPDFVVRIDPNSLALQYIENNSVLSYLGTLDVRLEPFFRSLWRHVLMVEIIRKRYQIGSASDQTNVISRLMNHSRSTNANKNALRYLEEFGSSFWNDMDVRVREIVDRFQSTVEDASRTAGVQVGNGVFRAKLEHQTAGQGIEIQEAEIRETQRPFFQDIVNRNQIAALGALNETISEVVLTNENNELYIVIDDLDSNWVPSELRNILIMCLFDTVMDMQRIRHLKIVIALRTNLFAQLGYGDSPYHQEEKIQGLVMNLTWTKGDLWNLVERRVLTESPWEDGNDSVTYGLDKLLPSSDTLLGDAWGYITTRTLMRPRDVIAWMNEVLARASGKSSIEWSDIQEAEKKVSRERLNALRDEWKDPYVGIDRVLGCFRKKNYRITPGELGDILTGEIADLYSSHTNQPPSWLDAIMTTYLNGSDSSNWYSLYGAFAGVLVETSFLGVDLDGDHSPIYTYDPDYYLDLQAVDPMKTVFEIHPAFRSALEIKAAHDQ